MDRGNGDLMLVGVFDQNTPNSLLERAILLLGDCSQPQMYLFRQMYRD